MLIEHLLWFAAALVAAVVLVVFIYYQNNKLTVAKYTVSENIDHKIRIIQLSDLHGKQFGDCNSLLMEKINDQSPDMVVFTGDIISDSGKNNDKVIEFLRGVSEKYPLYCIMGNHENRVGVADEFCENLALNGINALRNEMTTTCINGVKVNLLGLDEYKCDENVPELMRKLENSDGYKIILSHFPEKYSLQGDLSYHKYDFDLMFAGHAHGGQWQFPIIGGVYAPNQGINPKFYEGIYDNRLIVSVGLGNSHLFRLFNFPQVVCVDIG